MILDSSAIVAVLLGEPEQADLVELIGATPAPGVGAPTLAETGIVLTARLRERGRTLLERFLQESGSVVIPFDENHYGAAIEAFGRYGKGRHPAQLNFGDCLTYAVARLAGEPLLAIGDDFTHTDLELAR